MVLLIEEIIDVLIPALIFMWLSKKVFLDAMPDDKKPRGLKKVRTFFRLMLLSPIGLFIITLAVLLIAELILKAYFHATGIADFSIRALLNPTITDEGFRIDPSANGTNEVLLMTITIAFMVAVPAVVIAIRLYCRVVGCSRGMGVFIYMAVLYMFVFSTIISFPLRNINATVSGVASTVSFIAMLLIFYLPSMRKIDLMRREADSKLLAQTNRLPMINFVLLVMLLGLEFMLDINSYLDYTYYVMILAFSLLLYASAQMSYNLLFKHIEEKVQIETLSREALDAEEEIVIAFAEITEAESGQTGKHVKRVSEYSRVIAKGMGLPPERVEQIRMASMMHDIGKLLIPPEVLEKTGKLTDEEFETIKTHVTIGESLLHNAPGEIMQVARLIAWQHHEWWNGKGYLGMRKEEIDIAARITAVADVYDALTSKRSYKKAWTSREAYDIIMKESGTHFDPEVTHAFSVHFGEIQRLQAKYIDDAEYNF